jgi:hypothetical protein
MIIINLIGYQIITTKDRELFVKRQDAYAYNTRIKKK